MNDQRPIEIDRKKPIHRKQPTQTNNQQATNTNSKQVTETNSQPPTHTETTNGGDSLPPWSQSGTAVQQTLISTRNDARFMTKKRSAKAVATRQQSPPVRLGVAK